jgi:hypothetical protein
MNCTQSVLTDHGTLGRPNGAAGFRLKDNRGLIAGFAQSPTPHPLGEWIANQDRCLQVLLGALTVQEREKFVLDQRPCEAAAGLDCRTWAHRIG